MSRSKVVFACTKCGATTPKWQGRCAGCGEWNTLTEERAPQNAKRASGAGPVVRAVPIGEVPPDGARRIQTSLHELDRVLGGGAVLGGVVLLGGEPGIGKSTLLMQALAGVASQGAATLYVTGEESAAQVAMRATRLAQPGMGEALVQATTELEDVERAIDEHIPVALVVDSIQTIRSSALDSAAGSVAQLREVATRLIDLSKRKGIALFLIGHVTKEGMLAGPKVLEHLVDTVLTFEGDATQAFRVVRASKNRFGPAHELAVFEMLRDGLREVPDPSALFLAERPPRAAGSVVLPSAEGSRPVLVEVQALVAPARMGPPRRVSSGVDNARLAILLAVLDRKAGVHVLDHDVFTSIAGGARVDERAADLAVAVAVVSSFRNRAIAPELAVLGEIGLAGELRAVPRITSRLAEARKMGFNRVILPRTSLAQTTPEEREGLELIGAPSLDDALTAAFD